MTNQRFARVTVASLRRALIYRPLAVLMSMLMLPSIPGVRRVMPETPASVEAQIGGCVAPVSNKSIIRDYCSPDGRTFYNTALAQLESDAVKAYLAMHKLPETDANIIYDYGREDLRTEIRALISSTMLGIVSKPAAARTPHQQQLYNWLQTWVHKQEVELYDQAIAHYNSWVSDPCHFALEAPLAKAYGISYDGAPFCGQTLNTWFGLPAPTVPNLSYFKAYGLRHSYGKPADTFANYGSLLARMNINLGAVAGTATAAGVILSLATGAGLIGPFTEALAAYAAEGFVGSLVVTNPTFIVSGAGVETVGTAGLIAGPVIIILITIAMGVAAGVQVFENQAAINQLNGLKTERTAAFNTPPDIGSFALDTTGVGLFKIQTTILARTLPDVPSTKALPKHREGVDPLFFQEAYAGRPFTYRDWDGNVWTARTWGPWIVQTCRDGATSTCAQTDSITTSLLYRQPTPVHPGETSLENWTATRFGTNFAHTRSKLWRGYNQVPCEADAAAGRTTREDRWHCLSYVDPVINYEDGDGAFLGTDLQQYSAVFSKPTYLSFTAGVPSTQTITLASTPYKSNVFVDEANGGTLLSNPNFTIVNGQGTADFNTLKIVFNGSPTAANQDYTLNLYAAVFAVKQTYTISVRNELKITSPATLSATAGTPVSFTVTATGSPAPRLSIDPEVLVGGLTFTDNGNGTATIAGLPTAPGQYSCVKAEGSTTRPCAIIASNSQGTIRQPFTIDLASAPTASVTPPGRATFTAGVYNKIVLSASGATTPVSWAFFPDPAAPWLTLRDNGTGTAVLSGTPPLGTAGTFSPAPVPTALGSRGIAPVFPVTVVSRAQFTTPNRAVFTVGGTGTWEIAANLGTIALDSVLPKGLSFTAGNPARITGVPAAGTGGQYIVTLTDEAGGETVTQALTLDVNEAPQIKSANLATMFVGMPGSFTVATTGYPSFGNYAVDPTGEDLPGINDRDGMQFTLTGLPASLSASNLNEQGFATGTLTIQGTPTAADLGPHQVQITARNGIGVAAQQTLTLSIVGITGPAPANGFTCNGNYNGTFNGNILVRSGQNCSFYFGGVTGSVTVLGGSFAAAGANITGNVYIQGGSGFALETGTTIGGSLSIVNVGSASKRNELCGTRVNGNVNIFANAVPVTVGSTEASCQGNVFGKNVGVTLNSGPIQLYENDVVNNLTCLINKSVAGSGNVAQKKIGQCGPF